MRPSGARMRRRRWVVRGVSLLTFLLLFGAASTDIGVLDRLTALTFDTYQRVQPREQAGAPVAVVDIDEASLRAFGQWPWPRWRVAELVEKLGAMGAAAIVFDVVFPEPDRLSLAGVVTALQAAG